MQLPKDRKRQNGSSAKAAGRICLSWTQRQVYPLFSWWGQKHPRKNYWSYIWRFTNCLKLWSLLLGNQCYLKRCCPPLKTTKGVRRKRHLQPWQGPIPKTPIPLEVASPRKERETAWWREVWPWYSYPWGATLEKGWIVPRTAQNRGWDPRVGTARDKVGKNKRGDATRCSLKTPLLPAALLTWRQGLVRREPPAKALT